MRVYILDFPRLTCTARLGCSQSSLIAIIGQLGSFAGTLTTLQAGASMRFDTKKKKFFFLIILVQSYESIRKNLPQQRDSETNRQSLCTCKGEKSGFF